MLEINFRRDRRNAVYVLVLALAGLMPSGIVLAVDGGFRHRPGSG